MPLTRALLEPEIMEYVIEKAKPEDIGEVFSIYKARVSWMDLSGISQWNTTDYLNAYPVSYYRQRMEKGQLYVLRLNGRPEIVGSAVMLEEDDYWPDSPPDVCYIHNLATLPTVPGIGKRLIEDLEQLALKMGKTHMRLDCAVDNSFLNGYYESMEYALVGRCQDGPYLGNCREKSLK